jgi:phytoene dehydrogenase-like protein
MTERHDIVVVGGGLAGLIATATAARLGTDVVLVEARGLGGRARTTARDGFQFNQGAHAVYRRGALAASAQRLGVTIDGATPALGGAHVWSGQARHRLPVRPADIARTKLLRMRSKLAARKVFSSLDDGVPSRYAHVSLSEFLADARAPADLTAFVEMFARLTTYANAPDLISAEAFIDQWRIGGGGVLYLHGGWQQLVDSFADVALRSGAKILDHRPVLDIAREGGDWVVRTAAGDLVGAALILAAGTPQHAQTLLGEDVGWAVQAGPVVRVACLDLGVARPPEVSFMLDMDEPYYLSTHAPPARLAPAEHQLISLARYLRPGEHLAPDMAQAGLWQHAERAGVQREHVVAERYLHEMVVAGGLPLASQGGAAGRPPVAVADHPGLFVAGDWVGGTGMFGDAAAASGEAAAIAASAAVGERAA